mmetsp:Transcript_4616/g.9448  ORF Transcript_4616/g.9448 Transcript_4616/m.9448 type:complete len:296 (-) Transcript_4616:168-1055(-)
MSQAAAAVERPSTMSQASARGERGERADGEGKPAGGKFDRLATGAKRDDLQRPKSLMVAEQLKQQEERKAREAQEAKQAREAQREAQRREAQQREAQQREAAAAAAASSQAARQTAQELEAATSAPAHAGSGAHTDEGRFGAAPKPSQSSRLAAAPAVPAFGPDPSELLRKMDLPPKLAEDNYEISECGADSDDEADHARDRGGKDVPQWCETYLAVLGTQADVDPDTIFSSKVPACRLEDVFPDELYKQAGKSRPKRQRGSSGDWRKDRLRREEIRDYKQRMGHVRPWNQDRVA